MYNYFIYDYTTMKNISKNFLKKITKQIIKIWYQNSLQFVQVAAYKSEIQHLGPPQSQRPIKMNFIFIIILKISKLFHSIALIFFI
jgi:hypothetical protein